MRSGVETAHLQGLRFSQKQTGFEWQPGALQAAGSASLLQWQVQGASNYTLLTLSCFTQKME